MRPPPQADWYVESLARGLNVLSSFSAEEPSLRVTDVSRRTGLSRAASRRLLMTLVQEGYAGLEGDRFFLRPRVLDLGFCYLSSMGFADLARPILADLARDTGEAASVAILDGLDTIYVARASHSPHLNVFVPLGARFPAYATSLGRVLLAGLAPAELERRIAGLRLTSFTPASLRSKRELLDELKRVRAQGWSSTANQLKAGIGGVAVPIRDPQSDVRAALNVHMIVPPDAVTLDASGGTIM